MMRIGTAARMRAWAGPAVLTIGFRPFFLAGALWAAFAMALWITMLAGRISLPTRFDPVSWHAHEFLFGYLGAIIAGFLLTAVPNWTGRLPVTGWRLGALALFWLAGRGAVMMSASLPWVVTAAIDLTFPVVLGAVILREIVIGRNWRNLVVLVLLTAFLLANGLFHWQAARGDLVASGSGLRLGLAVGVMMIAVIGGRIVPSFTRNWLAQKGSHARPAPPMQGFDKAVLGATVAALAIWVAWPLHAVTAIALLFMGFLQCTRLARWSGWQTRAEPLVWVLHAGYGFVPLGALAMGVAILWPDVVTPAVAQHVWMAGAIGLMTLAVMTRATLGHSGRDLRAGPGTCLLYAMLIGSVLVRLAAGSWPAVPFIEVAAVFWIGAFGGFVLLYGPLLLRGKQEGV